MKNLSIGDTYKRLQDNGVGVTYVVTGKQEEDGVVMFTSEIKQ